MKSYMKIIIVTILPFTEATQQVILRQFPWEFRSLILSDGSFCPIVSNKLLPHQIPYYHTR